MPTYNYGNTQPYQLQPSYQTAPQTYYTTAAQPPTQTNGSLMTVYVNNEDDVTMYPVAAGTTVMLISFEQKKFWLKSRGTNGVPMPLRSFSFEELAPSYQNQNTSVSREEFSALSSKLDKLIAELGGAKSE